jgi:type II secretory ATPase GspE/PulE/Tfp pilus assembly ATPase PilB-like protein
MRMSDAIRSLILQRAPVHEIERVAIAEGMRTLGDDGYEKVRAGETTIAEVVRVTS